MKRTLTAIFATLAFCGNAAAQHISLPPNTVEGFLSNGLHYVILPNSQPRHTLEVRLLMSIGSLQEEDNQKGVAHFLEHMASAGTKRFPGNTMVDYFERQGMKYGRDINAFTGFDRTLYWFTLPVDEYNRNIVDSTLAAVRGIINDITFDAERVKRERGVIVEELRGYSTGDMFYNLKIGRNHYSKHLPLGGENDIMTMDRQRLIEFYRKWYSPSTATLIMVGDVDAGSAEKKVREILGDIPPRQVKKKEWPLSYPKGLSIMEVKDSLDERQKFELIVPHKTIIANSIHSMAEKAKMDMFVQAVSARLNGSRARFTVSNQWYLANTDHFVITCSYTSKEQLLKNITDMVSVVKHFGRYGLDKDELSTIVEEKIAGMHIRKGTSMSESLCEDFVDFSLAGDRHLYNEDELQKIKLIIRNTKSDDFKLIAQSLLAEMKKHTLAAFTSDARSGEKLTKKDILGAINRADADKSLPYTKPQVTAEEKTAYEVPEILAKKADLPVEGVIESTKIYRDLDVKEVKLTNEMTLLFKRTINDDKKLQVSIIGRGGTDDIKDDSDYYRLRDAVSYIDMGGIENVNHEEMRDVLGEKQISSNICLDGFWHEIMGTCNSEDAQILFNLLYEKIHHPQLSRDDFEEAKKAEIESWGKETLLEKLMARDPARCLNNVADRLMKNVIQRNRAMQKQDLEAMSLDSMCTYYKRLFTNPEGKTVLIIGNYNQDEVENIAISVFGRMSRTEKPLDVRNTPVCPEKTWNERFDNDNDSQTIYNFLYSGNYDPSLRNTLMFKLMRDLLQQRVIEILRKKMNIVYSPFVDVAYKGVPQQIYYFWFSIAVKNENRNILKSTIRDIIDDLQKNPVSLRELDKMRRSFIVTKRRQLNDNSMSEWKSALSGLLRNGEDIQDFDSYSQVLYSITPEDVRKAFCKYINKDVYVNLYQSVCKE